MSAIAQNKTTWHEREVAKSLVKAPERKPCFETSSGIEVERLYTPDEALADSCQALDERYLADLGFPGEYPYTRGVQPTMYRGRLWTMRMFAGFGAPEHTNERFKYLL